MSQRSLMRCEMHGARVAAAQQHGDLRRQPRMIGRRHGPSITPSALFDVIGVFVLRQPERTRQIIRR